MNKPAVYCSYDALGELCLYADRYPEWSKAINKYCHVFVDINPAMIETDEIFQAFFSTRPHLITSEAYYLFREIDEADGAEEYIKSKPFSIFILNRTEEECLELSKRTGVIVISDKHIKKYLNLFESGPSDDLTEGDVSPNRWQMLRIPKPLPCNGIIVIDNFLFDERHLQNSLLNVVSLIKEFYDGNLQVPFQVLLVFSNSRNSRRLITRKEIEEEIIKPFNKEFDEAKVELGVVVHTNNKPFHKRQVISNFHRFVSDGGFDAFNKNLKVIKKNDFYRFPMFMQIKAGGNCEIDRMFEHFALLKTEIEDTIMKTKHNGASDALYILGNIAHRFLD